MSIALIAVVVVLVVSHALPGLAAWRQIERPWRGWQALGARIGIVGAGAGQVLWLLLPFILLYGLQLWLAARWWGVLLLPYGVLMLFLCWGPADLDADARALADAEDEGARQRARSRLGMSASASGSGAAVAALFRAALQRWFAPLFWFVLLGGAGALLYRFAQLACREPSRGGSPLDWLQRLLNWPVAALTTLSLALVAHFDAVAGAWKRWHDVPERSWFGADLGFLDAAAQASVVCELQEDVEEAAEVAAEVAGQAASAPLLVPSDEVVPTHQAAIEDSLSLLRRILVLWMALLALAVLGGIAG
jgi:AmpE protein